MGELLSPHHLYAPKECDVIHGPPDHRPSAAEALTELAAVEFS